MTHHERDQRLGTALRQLPVPDHAPGFWDELERRLTGEPDASVVRLDERRRPRHRALVALGAAAAVVATVVSAGLVLRDRGDGGRVATVDEPGRAPAAPAMLTAAYTSRDDFEAQGAEQDDELTVAVDGSFRWRAEDGSRDIVYDAASGRVLQVRASGPAGEPDIVSATTGMPPGGPERYFHTPEKPLADFVVSLARAGDPRVVETDHAATDRGVWRYDGPVTADRLSGGGSPDRVVVEVDRATGVVLSLRATAGDRMVEELQATSVETFERIDRSRFEPDDAAWTEASKVSTGFEPVSLEEARGLVPYDLLVPEDVPEGFRLDVVALNRDVPTPTGAEGSNPPVADVVAMRWSNGYQSFTVTQRPAQGRTWSDPFGMEGFVFDRQQLDMALPGRLALEGEMVVDAPAPPHLWGVTGDVVVTVDGDLSPEELVSLAGSLRATG